MVLAAPEIRSRRVELGGRELELVESTTSRWLFDGERRRFLRLSRDTVVGVGLLTMTWQPYIERRPTADGRGVVVILERPTDAASYSSSNS